MKTAQFLAALVLLLVVSRSSSSINSSEWPLGGNDKAGGGVSPGSGMSHAILHHDEFEPTGVHRNHEVHRLPTGSFAEGESSRTDTSIIGGVFVWLESLHVDLTGMTPATPVFPPEGISKSTWFVFAWNGMWAWSLWDEFDSDNSGFMSMSELTTRWSSDAMRVEFGSPVNSPSMAEYNGYFEHTAYTVLLFRKWDADKNGALDLQEFGNTTLWKKGLVNEETFKRWAAKSLMHPAKSLLDPAGFMALLWNSFSDSAQLSGPADAQVGSTPSITKDNFAFEIDLWLDAIHEILDSNRNGMVEASEWYAATSLGKWADVLWHHVDKNGDGQLVQHEFQQEMPSAMVKEFGGAPPSLGDGLNAYLSYAALSVLIFRTIDADNDGHLQWTEIQNGPLHMLTEKEGLAECGNLHSVQRGVMTGEGFKAIAGDGEDAALEFDELVGVLASVFSSKFKR